MNHPRYITHPDFRHNIARVGNPTPAFLDPPLIGSVEYELSDGRLRTYFPGIGVRDLAPEECSPAHATLANLETQRQTWDRRRDEKARDYVREYGQKVGEIAEGALNRRGGTSEPTRPSREDYLRGPVSGEDGQDHDPPEPHHNHD